MTTYVVFGLPGVGKSTVAKEILKLTGASIIDSDDVRDIMTDFSPTYSDEENDEVYETMLNLAESHSRYNHVAIEATFSDREWRERVRQRIGVDKFIRVVASPPVAKERIAGREGAGIEAYRAKSEEFDPVEVDHEVIDNSGEWVQTQEQVRSIVLE